MRPYVVLRQTFPFAVYIGITAASCIWAHSNRVGQWEFHSTVKIEHPKFMFQGFIALKCT